MLIPSADLQHVGKSPPPEPRFSNHHHAYDNSLYSESLSVRAGPPYVPSSRVPTVCSAQVVSPDVASASSPPDITSDVRGEAVIAHSSQRPTSPVESAAQVYARSYVESLRTASNRHAEFSHDSPISASRQREDVDHVGNAVELGAIPIVAAPGRNSQTNEDTTFWRRPTNEIRRQPHQSPVLSPEYRYCLRDEIVKPPRTHHCRICGTVSRSAAPNWSN